MIGIKRTYRYYLLLMSIFIGVLSIHTECNVSFSFVSRYASFYKLNYNQGCKSVPSLQVSQCKIYLVSRVDT